MKGLLLKDCYVLSRQMKFFLALVIIFSIMPSMFVFGIIYASMLPYTALALDERSKWDQLAAAMPYSRRDMVLSKYILGWLASAAALLISLLSGLIRQAVTSHALSPILLLLAFCCALLVLDITLPAMFRFGVERGRILTLVLIVLVCGFAGALGSLPKNINLSTLTSTLAWIFPVAAVLLTPISVLLSLRLYEKHNW